VNLSFLNRKIFFIFACGLIGVSAMTPSAHAISEAHAAEPDAGLRTADSQEIAPDQFLSSDASRYFQAGDYEKALVALNQLEQSFPKDELIQRYRAMTLDRLGKSDEAIVIFNALLEKNPKHIPTRYFLGQAFARSGRYEEAAQEWTTVAQEGEGTPYAAWSLSAIQQMKGPDFSASDQPEKIQRWYIQARYGYEVDSNVILRPEDKNLSIAGDRDAGRHSGDLALRYRAYSKRDTAIDLTYAARQTLHDDSFEEFNYHSEEFGINARQRVKVGEKDVVLGARYEYLLGFLDKDIYSNRNRWTLSADTRFTERTQTIFFDRMTVANYGPDGSEPSKTSRDGFENDVGFTHFFYSKDFQRYVFFRGELNTSENRGSNFDSWGTTFRLGYHTPVPKFSRFSIDVSSGLSNQHYPDFESTTTLDPRRREDLDWDLYAALSYAITKTLSARFFYNYFNTENNNDIYEYNRHIGGLQFIYSRSA